MDNKIQAVLDEELIDLLKELNYYQKLLNGELNCCICGNLITDKNLQIILPEEDDKLNFICNRIECITKFYEEQ